MKTTDQPIANALVDQIMSAWYSAMMDGLKADQIETYASREMIDAFMRSNHYHCSGAGVYGSCQISGIKVHVVELPGVWANTVIRSFSLDQSATTKHQG
jgi:hypothetical protein